MAGTPTFDLLIVGGGINGAGVARDAAGRNLKVLLVEKDDLASQTSSASTKLIHGGLRYLEQLEFRLVRESLVERERLWGIAPHIVHPLDFVVPQAGSTGSASSSTIISAGGSTCPLRAPWTWPRIRGETV
jgi:glycerol-3-phosphate dehydrogenase